MTDELGRRLLDTPRHADRVTLGAKSATRRHGSELADRLRREAFMNAVLAYDTARPVVATKAADVGWTTRQLERRRQYLEELGEALGLPRALVAEAIVRGASGSR